MLFLLMAMTFTYGQSLPVIEIRFSPQPLSESEMPKTKMNKMDFDDDKDFERSARPRLITIAQSFVNTDLNAAFPNVVAQCKDAIEKNEESEDKKMIAACKQSMALALSAFTLSKILPNQMTAFNWSVEVPVARMRYAMMVYLKTLAQKNHADRYLGSNPFGAFELLQEFIPQQENFQIHWDLNYLETRKYVDQFGSLNMSNDFVQWDIAPKTYEDFQSHFFESLNADYLYQAFEIAANNLGKARYPEYRRMTNRPDVNWAHDVKHYYESVKKDRYSQEILNVRISSILVPHDSSTVASPAIKSYYQEVLADQFSQTKSKLNDVYQQTKSKESTLNHLSESMRVDALQAMGEALSLHLGKPLNENPQQIVYQGSESDVALRVLRDFGKPGIDLVNQYKTSATHDILPAFYTLEKEGVKIVMLEDVQVTDTKIEKTLADSDVQLGIFEELRQKRMKENLAVLVQLIIADSLRLKFGDRFWSETANSIDELTAQITPDLSEKVFEQAASIAATNAKPRLQDGLR